MTIQIRDDDALAIQICLKNFETNYFSLFLLTFSRQISQGAVALLFTAAHKFALFTLVTFGLC